MSVIESFSNSVSRKLKIEDKKHFNNTKLNPWSDI